jgi:polyhydroxyalkanoate synthesis repressor PhaR
MAALIKRYPNRRLYDTQQSRYITLEDLAARIEEGHEVKVVESTTGDDVTRRVLLQVLLTDAYASRVDCIPVELLRTLIRLRDPSLMRLFEKYVNVTLSSFALAQRTLQQNLEMLQEMAPSPADLLRVLAPWAGGGRDGRGGRDGGGGGGA